MTEATTGNRFSGIQNAEQAHAIWAVFHSLAIEAMERETEIQREEIKRQRADLEQMKADMDHMLKEVRHTTWRIEMKKQGYIQGGGKKRKNRRKPKLKLLKAA